MLPKIFSKKEYCYQKYFQKIFSHFFLNKILLPKIFSKKIFTLKLLFVKNIFTKKIFVKKIFATNIFQKNIFSNFFLNKILLPKIFSKIYFQQKYFPEKNHKNIFKKNIFAKYFSQKKGGGEAPCCPQGLGWYRAIARSQPSSVYFDHVLFVIMRYYSLLAAGKIQTIFTFCFTKCTAIDFLICQFVTS